MARFDLLDEYACLVVPRRPQSGADGRDCRDGGRSVDRDRSGAVAMPLVLALFVMAIAVL